MGILHKDNQTNEAALIRELKNDSVKAFDAIYNMYFRRLYVYCLQFTKSHKDTEDMIQEIFMSLWTSRHGIMAEDSLQYFLFRVAKNKLISAYRANINSPRYEEYLNYRETIGAEDHSPMEYEEFVTRIETCLSELPPAQCKIVKMSRFQQMSSHEIAQQLGIGEQTVKNQLCAGLRSLRRKLILPVILLFC